MARVWRTAGPETLKHYIDTILDEASDELNDWETKFIEDMQIRVANGWPTTQTQEEKLEQIYAAKTK
jgi:hypothetical protein